MTGTSFFCCSWWKSCLEDDSYNEEESSHSSLLDSMRDSSGNESRVLATWSSKPMVSQDNSYVFNIPGASEFEIQRKIVVLGFRGVGKSALIARLVDDRFISAHEHTIEYTFRTTLVQNNTFYSCDILDTSAQDEYSTLSRQACIGVHGYVLVYSITSRISYENIKIVKERLTSILCGSSIPMMLVATKCDWDEYREVSAAEGQSLAASWGFPFLECSAKANINVGKVFNTLLATVEKQSGFYPPENHEACTII